MKRLRCQLHYIPQELIGPDISEAKLNRVTLARMNNRPRLPATLLEMRDRPAGQFVILDIGARSSSEAYCQPLAGQLKIIGFDDSAEEDSRPDGAVQYEHHATILAAQHGRGKFFKTAWPFSSGLHKPNMDFLDRFPCRDNMVTVEEVELETTTLDRFAGTLADDNIDFIKVDVEGAELDVLRGGKATLRDKRVLGVKTEFWWDPILRGQPSFAELDIFLRECGFYLFDLEFHNYHSYMRRSLPAGRLVGDYRGRRGALQNVRHDSSRYGQVLTGDALYFRDPIADRISGRHFLDWDRGMLLRLCALLDIFDYGDCAIELLQEFGKREEFDLRHRKDFEQVIDALTPDVDVGPGKSIVLDYASYRSMSESVRARMDAEQRSVLNLGGTGPRTRS